MSDAMPPENPTHWEFARALEVEGKSIPDIINKLKERGLDAESATVLANSLPSAPGPSLLPHAKLDVVTNPLSGGFTSADIGMQGPRRLTGLYWSTLGAILFLILVGLVVADDFEMTLHPMSYGVRQLLKIFAGLSVLVVGFGVFKMMTPGQK